MNLPFISASVSILCVLSLPGKVMENRFESEIMNRQRCLVMFARYPEKGQVKSRLNLDGDESLAADLYRCFIEDLLEELSTGNYQFWMAYDPPERKLDFIKLFGSDFLSGPQRGADLGKRMCNAFTGCFLNGFQSVALIGSDSPDLPARIIEEAFDSLEKSGAVIGPALDGGYYLIGFSRNSFSARVFENMAWSTGRVFAETMRRFREDAVSVHVLPQWRDMDRREDLRALFEKHQKSDFGRSRTIRFLKEHGLTG